MPDKIKDITVIIVFIGIIMGVFVINLVNEDKKISIAERRKLAEFPNFTLKNLSSGNFAKQFDQYTMDEFFMREEFRKLKIAFELDILKKQDVNKIYKHNNYLIEQTYPLNEQSVINITNKMNDIKARYLNETNKIYYTIIPDKNYFVDENNLKLDYDKMRHIMSNNLEKMQYIDIFSDLELDNYYYTDSHWKQEKIIDVAKTIANNMGFDITENYIEQEVATFRGVYAGQLPTSTREDKIKILTNETILKCEVYNYETQEKTGIYNFKKIKGYDKYNIYLSGATPLLQIKNPNSKTNKELIVFRDSYGSSLIPLLTEEYANIIVIDTRYISPKILENYVKFEEKDVLFAYSVVLINNSTGMK